MTAFDRDEPTDITVTAGGGADAGERGSVCVPWADPAVNGPDVIRETAGKGTGDFSAKLTSLAANTVYHVRAYAVNSVDTAYGVDRTFTANSGNGTGGGAAYSAGIKTGGVITDMLPVTVNGATGAAGLSAAQAAKLFRAGDAAVIMPAIPGAGAYRLELPVSALTGGRYPGAGRGRGSDRGGKGGDREPPPDPAHPDAGRRTGPVEQPRGGDSLYAHGGGAEPSRKRRYLVSGRQRPAYQCAERALQCGHGQRLLYRLSPGSEAVGRHGWSWRQPVLAGAGRQPIGDVRPAV